MNQNIRLLKNMNQNIYPTRKETARTSFALVIVLSLVRAVFWVMWQWLFAGFLLFLFAVIALTSMTLSPYDSFGFIDVGMQALLFPLILLSGDATVSSSADILVIFTFWTILFAFIDRALRLISSSPKVKVSQNKLLHRVYVATYSLLLIVSILSPANSGSRISSAMIALGMFFIGYIFFGLYVLFRRSITNWQIKA